MPPTHVCQLPVIFPGNPLQEPGVVPVDGPLLPIHFDKGKFQKLDAASAIGPVKAINSGDVPPIAAQ